MVYLLYTFNWHQFSQGVSIANGIFFFFFFQAILANTMVTNLDTGEVIPLSAAEERIPQGHGWSPLSEHLLRRTNEALVGICCHGDIILLWLN